MSEWREFTIGDIADVFDGPHATPKKVTHGPWFLSISSLKDGRLALSESAHVTEEDFIKWTRRVTPQEGDVLFSYETRLGEAALMSDGIRACLGRRMGLLRPKREAVDPNFLLLSYLSPRFQSTINSRKIPGATVDRIPLVDLPRWPIHLPPLPVQQQIAATLGALNDKIVVNERVTSTALALANSVFSVEASGVSPGEDTFGSVARVAGGGTPKTKEDDYWGGDVAWATPKDITALESPYLFETGRTITPLGLENCASELYPAQSIFMTSRATIGAFALPQIPAAVNQGFIVVIPPTDDLRWWLFHEMHSRVDEMLNLANGSTFLELSRKNFKAMPIRMPAPEVIQRFSSRVKPLHESARNAASESRTLAELRDTLLPQLMSGKLRVKDAEKIVEDNV